MHIVVGKDSGKTFALSPAAELGRGAEGVVYRSGVECVKLLTGGLDKRAAETVELLVRLGRSIPGFAWPTELVLDRKTREPAGYALPFAAGESLETQMDARRTAAIPVEMKVRLALAVARAVAAAHALPGPTLVLGDALKAGNLVIDGDTATIVDAASVSVLGFRSAAGRLVDSVHPLTTPGYVPPEVLAHPAAKPSHAADKFALAVLLYELLFGRPPTEPHPCPEAVGLDPDDAVRDRLFLRWVSHPDLVAPTYDPVSLPDAVDELFRAAFLTTAERPEASLWVDRLDEWLAAVTAATAPTPAAATPPEPWRLPAVNWARIDRWVAALALVGTATILSRWAWTEGPAWVGEAKAAVNSFLPQPPPTPAAEPPVPAKPVGPPLFREVFK